MTAPMPTYAELDACYRRCLARRRQHDRDGSGPLMLSRMAAHAPRLDLPDEPADPPPGVLDDDGCGDGAEPYRTPPPSGSPEGVEQAQRYTRDLQRYMSANGMDCSDSEHVRRAQREMAAGRQQLSRPGEPTRFAADQSPAATGQHSGYAPHLPGLRAYIKRLGAKLTGGESARVVRLAAEELSAEGPERLSREEPAPRPVLNNPQDVKAFTRWAAANVPPGTSPDAALKQYRAARPGR
jgi:hypothetical protein